MEHDKDLFSVKENKTKTERGLRLKPTTRYSIYKGGLRVVDIPDHFPPTIQQGIGNSIIAAWRKSGILPIIKL